METKPGISKELNSEINRITSSMRVQADVAKPESETRKNNKRTRVYFQIALEHLSSRRDALTADNMRALVKNSEPPWTGSDFDNLSLEIAKLREDYLDTEFREDERIEISGGESSILPEITEVPVGVDCVGNIKSASITELMSDEDKEHLESLVSKPDNRIPNALFALTGLDAAIQDLVIKINRGEDEKIYCVSDLRNQTELIQKSATKITDILKGRK